MSMMTVICAILRKITPTLMVEGRIGERNNKTAKMGVAPDLRLVNDTHLLCATDLACVSRLHSLQTYRSW